MKHGTGTVGLRMQWVWGRVCFGYSWAARRGTFALSWYFYDVSAGAESDRLNHAIQSVTVALVW
eukprot:scaffold10517_cov56-Attheya_sp.AAC.2